MNGVKVLKSALLGLMSNFMVACEQLDEPPQVVEKDKIEHVAKQSPFPNIDGRELKTAFFNLPPEDQISNFPDLDEDQKYTINTHIKMKLENISKDIAHKAINYCEAEKLLEKNENRDGVSNSFNGDADKYLSKIGNNTFKVIDTLRKSSKTNSKLDEKLLTFYIQLNSLLKNPNAVVIGSPIDPRNLAVNYKNKTASEDGNDPTANSKDEENNVLLINNVTVKDHGKEILEIIDIIYEEQQKKTEPEDSITAYFISPSSPSKKFEIKRIPISKNFQTKMGRNIDIFANDRESLGIHDPCEI